MTAAQIRLLPDARPLVERLGEDFFRTLPTHPGVYLLRDAAAGILYIGKAKNLRQRLGSYRVANPERLPPRLMRLLDQTRQIEWHPCPDERSALARETELLLAHKPRFNRAGVWPAPTRYLAWQIRDSGLELILLPERPASGDCHGPLGGRAAPLRNSLARALWCALNPGAGYAGIPAGWIAGRLPASVVLPGSTITPASVVALRLGDLFGGRAAEFTGWVLATLPPEAPNFNRVALTADLDTIIESLALRRPAAGPSPGSGTPPAPLEPGSRGTTA